MCGLCWFFWGWGLLASEVVWVVAAGLLFQFAEELEDWVGAFLLGVFFEAGLWG